MYMKFLQGETDFMNWEKYIYRQLETFDLWKYVEGTVLMSTLQEDEDQDDFVKSFQIYKMKFDSLRYYLNRAMYLKERINNISLGIIDKLIQIILFRGI